MISKWIQVLEQSPDHQRDSEQERAVADIGDLLSLLMEQQNVTVEQLAGRIGSKPSVVRRILQGDGLQAIRTVSNLFFALNRSMQVYAGEIGERRPMSVTEKVFFKQSAVE